MNKIVSVLKAVVFMIGVFLTMISGFAKAADYQEQLLLELMTATPGTVIELPEGQFEFDTQLSLTVDDVTIRGKGMERSVLSFRNQVQGAEGLLISANNVTLENFTIQDTRGDAIKINHARGVVIRGVKATWTQGPATDNGAYGFYPVLSKDILIEACEVSGASDAGIYVGQSENVIIRRNKVYLNVAGIEIENTFKADVFDNYVINNTGGILLFNLPDLSRQGEENRVFGNVIVQNNTSNFSAQSNTVADVPRGTGIMVMANKRVEIFHNYLADNDTSNLLIIAYHITGRPINDPSYDPFVESIFIHDNTFARGGKNPKGGASVRTRELIAALRDMVGVPFPDIVYDGSFHPGRVDSEGKIPNRLKICIKKNNTVGFLNLDAPHDFQNMSRDLAPHFCEQNSLPEVRLPFLAQNSEY